MEPLSASEFSNSVITDEPFNTSSTSPALGGQMAFGVIWGSMTVLAVLSNLLVLVVFFNHAKWRTHSNSFLACLAFTDFLGSITCMPQVMCQVLHDRLHFKSNHKLFMWHELLSHVFLQISWLTVVMLTIDRYQAVFKPIRHRLRRSPWTVFAQVVAIYVSSAVVWPTFVLLYCDIHHKHSLLNQDLGMKDWWSPYADSVASVVIVTTVLIWFPLAITTVLNEDTDSEEHRKDQLSNVTIEFPSASDGNRRANRTSTMRRTLWPDFLPAFNTFFLTFLSLTISGLPWALISLHLVLNPDSVSENLYRASVFMLYTRHVAHPFCYAVTDRYFRRAICNILCLPCLWAKRLASSRTPT
ncbi:trace amine-associated receptor 6-like [Diadema setosum]|uniref:trace amine-associated receptor 6-like n=1 Tax=Diadema setosum TaxID=31175 RepID=UPI003B3ADF8B